MTVYRSVRVVFQNNTNETLTVQGCGVLRGTWCANEEPKQGIEIPKQSAAIWGSESQVLAVGTSAFVRLGPEQGYIQVSWSLPWVGAFECRVQSDEALPNTLRVLPCDVDDRQPDAVVVSVTLQEILRTT